MIFCSLATNSSKISMWSALFSAVSRLSAASLGSVTSLWLYVSSLSTNPWYASFSISALVRRWRLIGGTPLVLALLPFALVSDRSTVLLLMPCFLASAMAACLTRLTLPRPPWKPLHLEVVSQLLRCMRPRSDRLSVSWWDAGDGH